MTKREALTQLLTPLQHKLSEAEWWTLFEALMAWATPDRVEIRRRIGGVISRHGYYDTVTPTPKFWCDLRDILVDAVCGTEEPVWCEHISSTTFMGKTVWLLQGSSCPSGVIFGMNLDRCPVCHVPRPSCP